MSAKHTPGPWGLTEHFVEGKYGSPDRWTCEITCPDNNLIVADIPEYRTYPEETPMIEANARLIAAAPDLYIFAQEIALGAYTLDEAADRARELIGKATGEQPVTRPINPAQQADQAVLRG